MANPRKPAAIKKGHNESKSEIQRRAEDEEKLKGSNDKVSEPPAFIANWDLAVNYYKNIYELLKETDILSNLDRMGVGTLAECLAHMELTNRIILEEGEMVVVDTKSGTLTKENPAIGTHVKFMDRFMKLSNQYGLSPSARATLSAMTLEQRESENDELAKILKA